MTDKEVRKMSYEEYLSMIKERKKRKPIPKSVREMIYKKYNGHCAYCGCKLEYKDMQVDHIIPHQKLEFAFGRKEEYTEQEIECADNYLPVCRSCNNYKGTFSLEEFRENLVNVVRIRKKDSMNKLAERYGMIEYHEWDRKFYFEKCEVEE